jgi:malate dehydrogenase (oxaloacetate-decarboxylating)
MSYANHSLTIRAVIPAGQGMLGRVLAAISDAGGDVVGVDIVRSRKDSVTRDITVYTSDEAHGEALQAAVSGVEGVKIEGVTDRIFMSHVGGKVGMQNRVPVATRDDLSMAYTPGVARVCMAIHHDFEQTWDYTIKGNSVMVVSDGSSVVGQGDLGPEAALPAVEAKCMFLREFAGIDGFPLPVTVRDPEEIAEVIHLTSSVFAGIHLTDIAAPRCFEVQRKLEERLDIPVFHDDQQGTAVALLAALTNALRVVGKDLSTVRVVVSGAGAAGTAIIKLLLRQGVGDVIAYDRAGALHRGMKDMSPGWQWLAENTNADNYSGDLAGAVNGADVFIGVSAPNLLTGDDIATMAKNAIVFALANPDPEVDPREARKHAAIVATGRSDQPNQINNVLAFPGVFRGMLDAQARQFTEEMALAAARAIADTVGQDKINASVIIPSVFDARVAPAVAAAIRAVAKGPIADPDVPELAEIDS